MNAPAPSVTELLARLVAFDTTSHKSNMGLVRFVQDYLADHGVAAHLIPTADGDKASLFATIGPHDRAGVCLSGHTDVVPVEGQAWTTDPWQLTARDGRLYGRGTTDMKGFLACALAMVPELVRAPLAVPVHLAFSYDEETGCHGVRPMIAEMGDRIPRPRMVFVGEPTSMQVVDAHKGPVRWSIDVTGRAAHSSMAHLGVNAITYAGRLLAEIDALAGELAAMPPDTRFEPSYPTLQVTLASGGTATNIVPVSAWLSAELRALPGFDMAAVESRLQAAAARLTSEMKVQAPETGITVRQTNAVPPFRADPSSEVVSLALKLAGGNETFAVSYATEAGFFQNAGAPSVVIGPGNIAQAHTADEWIAVSELDKCMDFLRRLADWARA